MSVRSCSLPRLLLIIIVKNRLVFFSYWINMHNDVSVDQKQLVGGWPLAVL